MVAKRTESQPVHTAVRPMLAADLGTVGRIERLAMNAQAWSECELRDTIAHTGCYALVLEADGKIAGYLVYERQRKGILLLRIVISPALRRRGYGRKLLQHMLDRLHRPDNTETMLEFVVRESELGVQLFARALGFKAVRVLPEFFEDTSEAGYWFQSQQETKPC
jgi:ribosomal-protein-alanine N-acetyltransferase